MAALGAIALDHRRIDSRARRLSLVHPCREGDPRVFALLPAQRAPSALHSCRVWRLIRRRPDAAVRSKLADALRHLSSVDSARRAVCVQSLASPPHRAEPAAQQLVLIRPDLGPYAGSVFHLLPPDPGYLRFARFPRAGAGGRCDARSLDGFPPSRRCCSRDCAALGLRWGV